MYVTAMHPQKKSLRHPIIVDEEMLDIIDWLWDFDIFTSNSCQNINGMCWIQFDSLSDESYLQRMARAVDVDSLGIFVNKWVSRTTSIEGADYEPSISWRFPAHMTKEFYDILMEITFAFPNDTDGGVPVMD